MTEKEPEQEINSSRENMATPPNKVISANFEKPESLVGQLLDGKFLIEKNLADSGADAGGIGLVYLAKDMTLMGKQTVVKILQKAALANEDIVRKFKHEKEALVRLDHPNIVRILASGTLSDGNPFMVMEFIEGFSLRRKLRETEKLDFLTAANIVESVTSALGAAHAKKILHRDIKPENIMLTPQEEGADRVRLIDFGIARVEDSLLAPATKTPSGIGTILYIAPEQLAAKHEQTPAIDIYSFAIVVYEMLTGELPFQPQSIVEMFELQKQGVQTLPSQLRRDLSPEGERLLLAALNFEPEKRPQTARQFGRDLARTLRENSNAFTGNEKTTEKIFVKDDFKTTPSVINLAKTIPSDANTAPETLTETSLNKIEADHYKQIPGYSPPKKSRKAIMWTFLALVILGAISIPIGLSVWNSRNKTEEKINANTETATPREITYFLNVQKMRGGKAFEEPFKSSGQEIFENGYKFKMNFQTDADGYFYLFNEDKDGDGKTIYNILYPTPKTNNGSAEIKAKEQIQTNQNTFSGESTTEIVWLIWTAERQNDLESARQAAFDGQGAVRDEKNVRLLINFVEKYKDKTPETSKDTANRQTVVKGKGNVIVYKIELEHR